MNESERQEAFRTALRDFAESLHTFASRLEVIAGEDEGFYSPWAEHPSGNGTCGDPYNLPDGRSFVCTLFAGHAGTHAHGPSGASWYPTPNEPCGEQHLGRVCIKTMNHSGRHTANDGLRPYSWESRSRGRTDARSR